MEIFGDYDVVAVGGGTAGSTALRETKGCRKVRNFQEPKDAN